MSLEQLKSEVATMSAEQQNQLVAYLVQLRHQRDSKLRAEITAIIDDNDPAKWISLDELREQRKD